MPVVEWLKTNVLSGEDGSFDFHGSQYRLNIARAAIDSPRPSTRRSRRYLSSISDAPTQSVNHVCRWVRAANTLLAPSPPEPTAVGIPGRCPEPVVGAVKGEIVERDQTLGARKGKWRHDRLARLRPLALAWYRGRVRSRRDRTRSSRSTPQVDEDETRGAWNLPGTSTSRAMRRGLTGIFFCSAIG